VWVRPTKYSFQDDGLALLHPTSCNLKIMLYPLSQLPMGVKFILKKNNLLSNTSDSHSSDCKDYSFLRCDPMRFGSQLPTTEDS
jgi:hypothetical protein